MSLKYRLHALTPVLISSLGLIVACDAVGQMPIDAEFELSSTAFRRGDGLSLILNCDPGCALVFPEPPIPTDTEATELLMNRDICFGVQDSLCAWTEGVFTLYMPTEPSSTWDHNGHRYVVYPAAQTPQFFSVAIREFDREEHIRTYFLLQDRILVRSLESRVSFPLDDAEHGLMLESIHGGPLAYEVVYGALDEVRSTILTSFQDSGAVEFGE